MYKYSAVLSVITFPLQRDWQVINGPPAVVVNGSDTVVYLTLVLSLSLYSE